MQHATSAPEGGRRHDPVVPPPVSPLVWGALLICGGVLFLLLSLGVFTSAASWMVGVVFAVLGLVFLYLLFVDPQHRWWAAIPGMTLVGLAATILVGEFGNDTSALWGGPLFLGSIALGFLLIVFIHREFWWVLIPGGVLATLSMMTYLVATGTLGGEQSAGFLFLGLGVTFLLVMLFLPAGSNRWWPAIPAAVLFVMGSLLYTDNILYLARFNWVGPAVLIAAGCWLVYRALSQQQHE